MAPPPLDEDYLQRFSEAVVQEIWNEMGRQRIRSLRELARRAGMTHTSLNARMGIDSRTGKPVVLNVRDIAAIGDALGVEPGALIKRAFEAADTTAPQLAIDWGSDYTSGDADKAPRRLDGTPVDLASAEQVEAWLAEEDAGEDELARRRAQVADDSVDETPKAARPGRRKPSLAADEDA